MTNRARTTDAAGRAVFDDLTPGPWTFSVEEPTSHERSEKTALVQHDAPIEVALDLAAAPTIAGTIRNAFGAPVPRATIECLWLRPAGGVDFSIATGDAEGKFAIAMAEPAPPVAICSAITPAGMVEAFRATPGEPLNVTLPFATATLQIADWKGDAASTSLWLVAEDGRAVSLRTVGAILGRFAPPLTIPIAAGNWKIVRIGSPAQFRALASGGGATLPPLASVPLRAGKMESIRLTDSSGPP
jgi:hypothetical protein